MTRETKLGLLVGVGIILLVGIIVSDLLSVSKRSSAPNLSGFADQAQKGLTGSANDSTPAPTSSGNPGSTGATSNVGTPGTPTPTPGVGAIVTPGTDTGATTPAGPTTPGREPVRPGVLEADRTPGTTGLPGRTTDGLPDGIDRLAMGDSARPGPLPLFDSAPGTSGLSGTGTPRATSGTSSLPDTGGLVHYVKKGENIADIARRYYGNSEAWRTIAAANKSTVGPRGELKEGARLAIPPKPASIPSTPGTPGRGVDVPTLAGMDLPGTGFGTSATSEKTVKVEAGDTLSKLAAKHLGATSKWDELLKANSDKLKRAQDLKPGMILRIPAAKATSTDTRTALGPTTRPADRTPRTGDATAVASGKTYTVQPGDTLAIIAKKTLGNANRWQDLVAVNKDIKPTNLKVGKVLAIPATGRDTAAAIPGAPTSGHAAVGGPRDTTTGVTGAPPAPGVGGAPTFRSNGGGEADLPTGTLIPITADPGDLHPATVVATRAN